MDTYRFQLNGKEVLKLNEELITGQKKIFSNTDLTEEVDIGSRTNNRESDGSLKQIIMMVTLTPGFNVPFM